MYRYINHNSILFFLLLLIMLLKPYKLVAQQSLWVGQTYKCDATSAVMGLTSDVSWTTSGGYLSLSGSGFYRDVTITKYFSGTATVKCSWKYRLYSGDNWRTQTRTWTIRCNDNPASISPTEMTLSPGETAYIGYSLKYSNNYSSSARFTFSSSNSSIAKVSNKGLVTGVSTGKTYINVYSNVSANSPYCIVTVKNIAVESATIPSSVSILADDSKQLSASVTPTNATIESKEWYSNDNKVATVNSDGNLRGISPGETTVYCVINGTIRSNDCRVIVREPDFTLVSVQPETGCTDASLFIEPQVTFSHKLYKGDNYDAITLRNADDGTAISGNLYLNDKTVSFKPSSYFSPNTNYSLLIPANALKNKWGTHYEQNVAVSFRTGNMKKLTLSIQPYEKLVPIGTEVVITCNVPEASIHYTTDNSIPDSNSSKYTSPIIISKKTTIKAIAQMDGYIDSDVLAQDYGIADLEMVLWPENGTNDVSKNVIPCVKFNQHVTPTSSFVGVSLWHKGKEIVGTPVCQDTIVYFVPKDLLETGQSYTLIIPENALVTENGEGNEEAKTSFSTGRYAVSCSASKEFGAVVMSDGSLWTWGDNYNRGLGDGTTKAHLTPVKIMDDVKSVSLGSSHGVALKNDGTAWTWGNNSTGQLGDGTTTHSYKPIKVMDEVSRISAGDSRTMFIKKDNTLWACGYNYYGQLGDGTTTTRKTPVKIMSDVYLASTGYYISAAVTTGGWVYTWGSNYKGALGGWPVSGSFDTGTKVPYKSYTDNFVRYIECGNNHVALLTIYDELRCAGDDASGQCGAYTNAYNGYPGMIRGGSTGYWNRWVTTSSNPDWKQISAGGKNTGALDYDGNLYVCGENENGMVGLIGGTYLLDCDYLYYKKLSDVSTFSIGDQMGIAIKTDGSVWTWGKNDVGQLGVGYTSPKEIEPVKILDGYSTSSLKKLSIPTLLTMKENHIAVLPTIVEPYNAAFDKIEWTTDNKDVADVSASGIVTAKSTGQCIVTANVYNDGELLAQASCNIMIEHPTEIGIIPHCNTFTLEQNGNHIYIYGIENGTSVYVYSVDGMLISRSLVLKDGMVAINLPKKGVYIVKAGNEARKVFIR